MEKYQTASKRFFALLIDTLVFLPSVYLERFFLTPETPLPVAIGGLIVSNICFQLYYILLHTFYGQTLGKMAMKIVVLDVSKNLLTYRQAVLREIVSIGFYASLLCAEIYQILSVGINDDFRSSIFFNTVLVLFFVWLLAESVVMLSNDKRRAIHDFIAGTVVVKNSQ